MWTVPTRVATPDGSSSSSSANSFCKVWFFFLGVLGDFFSLRLSRVCFDIDFLSKDSSADEDFRFCGFYFILFRIVICVIGLEYKELRKMKIILWNNLRLKRENGSSS